MGILGELPPGQMLVKLQSEIKKWQMADTSMEVIPALHYIAATAQMSPGSRRETPVANARPSDRLCVGYSKKS
ncbi:MAG: hypothetical protein WKG06_42470 [Segetibacter sp.]